MSIELEHIRSSNPIEQVIGETSTLKQQGTRLVGVEHDSLVVTPQPGLYFWNSRGEYGDGFDFAGRHLPSYDNRWNHRDATMPAALSCVGFPTGRGTCDGRRRRADEG